MKIKKTLNILCYYLLPILLLIASVKNQDSQMFGAFGSMALNIIMALLFLKPISQLVPHPKIRSLLQYRRQFGVASFWFFFFHASGLWYVYGLKDINFFLNPKTNLLYGAIAAIGMSILFITSNNYAAIKLKQNWRRIQQFAAYPTFFLILYHSALVERELGGFYAISTIYIVLKILAWKKIKFFKVKNNNIDQP